MSNERTFEFNAACFVIPNTISRFGKLGDYTKKKVIDFCKCNNITINDEDGIVQLWFHSEELKSTNLVDHGYKLDICGEKYCVDPGRTNIEYVPMKIFDGIKEGDVVDIKISPSVEPCKRYDLDEYNKIHDTFGTVDITLHTTCKQIGYRYQNFGKFEEAIEKVRR